jgi:hypothetical protein
MDATLEIKGRVLQVVSLEVYRSAKKIKVFARIVKLFSSSGL